VLLRVVHLPGMLQLEGVGLSEPTPSVYAPTRQERGAQPTASPGSRTAADTEACRIRNRIP
jgi:hypothetical protein